MMKLYLQLSVGPFALSVVLSDFPLHQPAIVQLLGSKPTRLHLLAPLALVISSDDHSQIFPPDVKIGNM